MESLLELSLRFESGKLFVIPRLRDRRRRAVAHFAHLACSVAGGGAEHIPKGTVGEVMRRSSSPRPLTC